jgi:hypothetical protein
MLRTQFFVLAGQAPPTIVEDPWRGLLVPLTGLFRGCEGRYANAGTPGVFHCVTFPSAYRWRLRVLHLEPIGASPLRLDTMPSSPSSQAWRKTTSPSP